ncbi:MAG: potassium transporter [Gammaproteobacteria bacterium]|nr:MAG: potassium transporter [Gammaproteobacteria bacterium]
MAHELIVRLTIVLAVATLLVAACRRLGLSPILGYLATGLVVGPRVTGWLPGGAATELLAELGVVLLMFSIGLEFSLPRLLAARRLVLGLGGAQLVLTALLLGGLAELLSGAGVRQAVVIGAALAMSSTAIVLKQLGEQLELQAPHGRIATGILLFQDLAAVPLLVAVPVLAAGGTGLASGLAVALAKAAAVFAGLAFVGRRLLPAALHWVAATRSLELFMLTALLLATAAAGLSVAAGLSPTLGAFMAGMLLGETEFRHQVEADIRPFRDVMLGVFFVSIGIKLDPAALAGQLPAVLAVLLALVIVKPVLLAGLVRAFGHSPADAWRSAISLAQGGEFGLLLISLAAGGGLLPAAAAQPVLGGIVASMLLAPLLLAWREQLVAWLPPSSAIPVRHGPAQEIAGAAAEWDGHVLICGYGRLGQNLAGILRAESIPALALDLDPERVRQAAAAGEPVLYGDAGRAAVLEAAGLVRCRALAVTMDAAATAERIVAQARRLGFRGPILVRSRHGQDDEALLAAGATVFPEGLEVSLAFAGQLLVLLDLPPSRVESRLNEIRAQDYAPLRLFFHSSGREDARQEARDFPEAIRAVVLDDEHHAAGRLLAELALEETGAELLDLRRGALRLPPQTLDSRLRAGDVLLLKGGPEALERAVARLIEGG